ncbi:hypothetical protein GCM10018787_45610 [Streptomyces thermodiastaticus]|nr:hypothetical protein GCM10018787_45610 [Streptomyces thermodiastaticus]
MSRTCHEVDGPAVTEVSAAPSAAGGKVDWGPRARVRRPGGSTQYDRSPAFSSEMPMTAHSASAGPVTPVRVRTGGPKGDGDGSALLEHVLGWLLVVVIAMLVTRLGLF